MESHQRITAMGERAESLSKMKIINSFKGYKGEMDGF